MPPRFMHTAILVVFASSFATALVGCLSPAPPTPAPTSIPEATAGPVSPSPSTAIQMPTAMLTLTPTAKQVLDMLNSWDLGELSIAECPKDYPGRVASGETNGWILSYKEQLRKLGIEVRWNCEKEKYEIVSEKQASSPVCGCH